MTKVNKDTLFKPKSANSKQATTDAVARQIIEAEAAAREAKTERLRKLRLARHSKSDGSGVGARPRKATKRRGKASSRPKAG